MSKSIESELVDRMISSAIVSVCTRYVVEVERELLQLRLHVAEKGAAVGNMELLGTVEERLTKVHDRMNGVSGDLLRLMTEVKRELSRIGLGAVSTVGNATKKRGRPAKGSDL